MQLREIQIKLKDRVAKGLNFGIEGLDDVLLPDSALYNDFILLKSKYNDLMHISANNTLPYEQIEMALNKLRMAVLSIIDRLESENLVKTQIDASLNVQALPTRRTNFFKLLDIHYKNLEAIIYSINYTDGDEEIYRGRDAINSVYHNLKEHCRREMQSADEDSEKRSLEITLETFGSYFNSRNFHLEVYYKNIENMLSYVLESEIEQVFFVNTIRSLFSKTELAMLFYYILAGMDDKLKKMVHQSGLISKPEIVDRLISPEHWERGDMVDE